MFSHSVCNNSISSFHFVQKPPSLVLIQSSYYVSNSCDENKDNFTHSDVTPKLVENSSKTRLERWVEEYKQKNHQLRHRGHNCQSDSGNNDVERRSGKRKKNEMSHPEKKSWNSTDIYSFKTNFNLNAAPQTMVKSETRTYVQSEKASHSEEDSRWQVLQKHINRTDNKKGCSY